MQKIIKFIKRLKRMELTGYEKIQIAACATERSCSAGEAILKEEYAEAFTEFVYLGIEAYGTLYGAYERTKGPDD